MFICLEDLNTASAICFPRPFFFILAAILIPILYILIYLFYKIFFLVHLNILSFYLSIYTYITRNIDIFMYNIVQRSVMTLTILHVQGKGKCSKCWSNSMIFFCFLTCTLTSATKVLCLIIFCFGVPMKRLLFLLL